MPIWRQRLDDSKCHAVRLWSGIFLLDAGAAQSRGSCSLFSASPGPRPAGECPSASEPLWAYTRPGWTTVKSFSQAGFPRLTEYG